MISEHFNVETLRNERKWKVADFDWISYRDVSAIIQSSFKNRSENWIDIFREHCSFGFRVDIVYDLPWRPLRPSIVEACSIQGPPYFRGSLRPKLQQGLP